MTNGKKFSTWLVSFRDSITDYGYYIDFAKVHRNVMVSRWTEHSQFSYRI